MRQYKDRNWLDKQYWENELNTYQIGNLCGCNQHTIWYWLKKLNIKICSKGERTHLATGNHCNLSNEAREWIDGELLGDACLQSRSKYFANIDYSSKYLEYIQYVSSTLSLFGIKQAGKIRKQYNKRTNCYTYKYCSLCYAELHPIYKKWYPNGRKIIPRDLKLTPLVLRQEMIGDGCLHQFKKYRPYVTLATCGFPISDVEWIVEELNKLEFKATRRPSNNSIRISVHSTRQFLEYIGDCPTECYKYKFNY